MDTPLTLLQNQRVRPRTNNANRPPRVLNPRNLHDPSPTLLSLIHQLRIPQLILRKRLDVRNRLAPRTLRDKLDLVSLDVFDDEDLEFGEEVEGEFVYCVAEDGLLDEEDVAAGFLDLLAHV